ncbi:MAG: hypothetical protein NVSMB62_03300 [Acidobacteriaceae bacterium]
MPLYLGFVATGIGVALPGATLPALLVRWHMSDAQGGRLFLFAWVGSSLGALAVRGKLRRSLLAGCAGIAVGAFGLIAGAGSATQANLWMAAYGGGLGLTMTSISLLRQKANEHSGTELIRLNFVWALGACLCPALAERTLRFGDLRSLLGGLGAVFIVLALWTMTETALNDQIAQTADRWLALRRVPPALVLMTMLVTGIEASAGGWLATYSRRNGDGLTGTIAAPTCLWSGLLLSRLVWAVWAQQWSARRIVRSSVALMAAAGIFLIVSSGGWTLLAAAFCLGFGIGPVYPLLLTAVLRFARTGSIFFLAGVGSACLPWLTGVSAGAQGSLRIGLLVPVVAIFATLSMAWLVQPKAWGNSSARSASE